MWCIASKQTNKRKKGDRGRAPRQKAIDRKGTQGCNINKKRKKEKKKGEEIVYKTKQMEINQSIPGTVI
jgi:hypothetical protein